MAKTSKREEAIQALNKKCIENPNAETAGPVRDYLGSVTDFVVHGADGDKHYRLTFHTNTAVPRCSLAESGTNHLGSQQALAVLRELSAATSMLLSQLDVTDEAEGLDDAIATARAALAKVVLYI